MPLKHVVLAVLAEAPAHGYLVHARVLQLLPAARPDTARVYRALGLLEGAGRVRSSWAGGIGAGPARKIYRVLPAGEEELRRWLERSRPGPGLLRRALLVRLALVDACRDGPTVEVREARRWRAPLDHRSRRRDRLGREVDGESPLRRLLRLREIAHLEAEIRALQRA